MIDFHSHVLAGMDDGSRSLNESRAMLDMQRADLVQTIVATPHFNPAVESVESFIQRRNVAVQEIRSSLEDIRLIPAAEVMYCRNLAGIPDIEQACIQGSAYMLIEFDTDNWNAQMVRDICTLIHRYNVVPVVAHVERYWTRKNQRYFTELSESGVLFQVSAHVITKRFKGRKFRVLIEQNRIHFVGSDCHNTTTRPPNLKKAFDCLRKTDLLACIEQHEKVFLGSITS